MFFDALEKTPRGVCACVFDATDRIQHMFWRFLEANHPAVNSETDRRRFGGVIEDLYRRMDDLVGRILIQVGDGVSGGGVRPRIQILRARSECQ